jgi:hypothetical protein
MTYREALQAALAAGYTHCNSYYSYHPRRIATVLRKEADYDDRDWWTFEDHGDYGIITNPADSEYHRCWRAS